MGLIEKIKGIMANNTNSSSDEKRPIEGVTCNKRRDVSETMDGKVVGFDNVRWPTRPIWS